MMTVIQVRVKLQFCDVRVCVCDVTACMSCLHFFTDIINCHVCCLPSLCSAARCNFQFPRATLIAQDVKEQVANRTVALHEQVELQWRCIISSPKVERADQISLTLTSILQIDICQCLCLLLTSGSTGQC